MSETAPVETPATAPQGAVSVSEPASAPAPAGDPAPPSGTLADGGDSGNDDKPIEGRYPEDWRTRFAGEDESFRRQLERFDSPEALARAYREAQKKISQGVKPATLKPDATPEEIAAYREANNIPAEASGYSLDVPNGTVFGEADKAVLEGFAQHAHSKNWSQQQMTDALEWYAKFQDDAAAQQQDKDDQFKAQAEDELRREWASDYRKNLNALQNLLAGAPQGLAEELLTARTQNGSGHLLGDHPAVLRWLTGLAREINPVGTLMPAGQDNAKGVAGELAEMDGWMRSSDPAQREKYWGSPQAQARYRELLEAQERLQKRA